MQSISTIGLDIAKSVFQVHGVDAAGQVVTRPSRAATLVAFGPSMPTLSSRFEGVQSADMGQPTTAHRRPRAAIYRATGSRLDRNEPCRA
jgi:hypothetical protein